MAKAFSKTQIDKLGERLKQDQIEEADLRMLAEYRNSFTQAFETVVSLIRERLALEPTGRPVKSTASITDKLRRESIRLSQIQDIAGCRIIVPDVVTQNEIVERITGLFEKVSVVDRRVQPSHGYRAVHVIVGVENKLVEVQVRTRLQHLWAELSERFSDFDSTIKYGGGSPSDQKILLTLSGTIRDFDYVEEQMPMLIQKVSSSSEQLHEQLQDDVEKLQERHITSTKKLFTDLLLELIESVKTREEK
ncbi:MAG: hypothetical protein HOP19_17510 [Acidobacteria bacterium]|nr:hypothetical protein [Acidobacteriota bacterium]